MVNIAFVVVVLSKMIRITYGHHGLGGIAANLNYATGDVVPNFASHTADFESISIPLVGNLGTIDIPLKTVCKTPGVYDNLFCFICNQDCFIIHNQHGGKCVRDPNNPQEIICVCAKSKDETKSRDIHISSKETCKKFRPSLPSSIAPLDDEVVRKILRNRLAMFGHTHLGGYCTDSIPEDSRLGTTKTRHCECNPRLKSCP